MSTYQPRSATSIVRRLQLILLLMIVWEALAILAELSFGGPLFELSGDKLSGLMAGRGAFGGAAVLPLVIYVYALRQPLRYRGLLWLGVLENGVAVLFSVFHLAVGDIEFQGVALPLAVSAVFVVLLLLNMPRGKVV
jgi:hypothetical protein